MTSLILAYHMRIVSNIILNTTKSFVKGVKYTIETKSYIKFYGKDFPKQKKTLNLKFKVFLLFQNCYCGANQAVTFLPSTIGFFSTVIGSLARSVINFCANSRAKFECCISRPLNITTILTLLP